MTVIAALINAEPAAGRQPVSRRLRPDVDVAHDHRAILLLLPLLSNEEIPRRKRRRRKRKEERFELEITTRWKIGDAIRRRAELAGRPSYPSRPSSPSFICGGINKNLRAIYGGSSARSGGSINLLRSARLARRLQNRRPTSLYEARID